MIAAGSTRCGPAAIASGIVRLGNQQVARHMDGGCQPGGARITLTGSRSQAVARAERGAAR